jgi:hypothetical protein
VADVEAVELVADLEEEHAEDDDADQHVEGDAQLDHHRHAVGGAGGGEEQAVLHGEEADHLGNRLGAVIIIRKASMTLASAMPRVPRLMVLESCEIGRATLKAMITRTMPTSMVVGTLMRPSTSAFTCSLRTRRCRIHGSRITFSTRVRAAEP